MELAGWGSGPGRQRAGRISVPAGVVWNSACARMDACNHTAVLRVGDKRRPFLRAGLASRSWGPRTVSELSLTPFLQQVGPAARALGGLPGPPDGLR